jgi:hypothetical protein
MPDGEFIWHPEADAMIEKGDFSNSPALPHMLRVLRKSEKKDAALRLARDALQTPWNEPYVDGCDIALGKRVKAIKAIDEALGDV